MEWDARPELIAQIRASIQPVHTDVALSHVLAEDFPRDCSKLPITGGWGYSQDDAIVFIQSQSSLPTMRDFVSLESLIVEKIIYEELIIFRPEGYKFSGIRRNLEEQSLLESGGRKYDHLTFQISCWSDWHWDRLKRELGG